jgi:tRNA G10  N-methylase Trm11
MKKYFFVLGSNIELSLAELKSLFPKKEWSLYKNILIADFEDELEVKNLIQVLGGTIKIGEIINQTSMANRKALSQMTKKALEESALLSGKERKFNFGFSFYGEEKIFGNFFKLGLAVKNTLKEKSISSRMVTSKEKSLSSVVVEQNKLIEDGLEVCFITSKKRVFIGKTLFVQDFKGLSKRDFGRPKRDDHSGMIPPKLAQIMINLARRNDFYTDKKILDPFCGSGTILMEALLMGFKNVIGSDISEKAILYSRENIDWLISDFKKDIKKDSIKTFESDALKLEESMEGELVDYIVCEPYLGPQRGYKDFNEVVLELKDLYTKALLVFYKILKEGGRVVMIWPQFRAEGKTWMVRPEIGKFNEDGKKIVYGREDQKVWREIVTLIK